MRHRGMEEEFLLRQNIEVHRFEVKILPITASFLNFETANKVHCFRHSSQFVSFQILYYQRIPRLRTIVHKNLLQLFALQDLQYHTTNQSSYMNAFLPAFLSEIKYPIAFKGIHHSHIRTNKYLNQQ